jgi:hypothetical protein
MIQDWRNWPSADPLHKREYMKKYRQKLRLKNPAWQTKLYRNKEWLFNKYVEEKLTTYRIADIYGFNRDTIRIWLNKFGITIRKGGKLMRGHAHPNYGNHLSGETKFKISCALVGRILSLEHRKKLSETHTGERHPNWQGGITPQHKKIRASFVYKIWKQSVLNRDNHTCQFCESKKKPLHAHHIFPFKDYPEDRFNIDNGITLCGDCHGEFNAV